jgi:uncharacterized membrane protein
LRLGLSQDRKPIPVQNPGIEDGRGALQLHLNLPTRQKRGWTMSKPGSRLVALIFDDPYKAEEAKAALHRMGGEGLLEIDETAFAAKYADGKVRVSQDVNFVGRDQKIGHIAGLLAATVTGTLPFIMVGTLAGRLLGKLTDHGITNKFLKHVSSQLQPDTSVLIVLAHSDDERRQKVLDRLQVFAPKLLESDFPDELEQELSAELHGEQALQGEQKKASGS